MLRKTDQHIVTALVTNKSGVLNRISGLFSRRGYNIESLSVASTEEPGRSRMTIVVNGDTYILEQITKQLDKVVDVIRVEQLDPGNAMMRELLLVKVRVAPRERPEIETTARLFKAKTIDVSDNAITLELTGEPAKLEGFIALLRPYGIIEMAKTGVTALERGIRSIADAVDYSEE
ncbi:MAG: acetolactate synthase small subunit [Clostridiales bacterium]|jgi:acetolactate synthase-1/3 small subunit|nr:acetolactate synthase small subunit [Clostridiales bacterium]